MAEEVRMWEVGTENELLDVQPWQLDKEERIEEWIKRDISVLDPALLVIGQQVKTAFGKFIDLLCMDSDGKLVIVELKRDRTPREVTAQALDYGSWVKDLDFAQIAAIAAKYFEETGSKYSDLESAFAAKFPNSDFPDAINASHGMRVVASEIDDSTERIIRYLSETYGVDINAACFRFFKTKDGCQLLVRTFIVAKEEAEANIKKQPGKRPPKYTEGEFLAMARENQTEELVEICRQMRDIWQEKCTGAGEGSFRYYANGVKTYAINVSGKFADAPQGQLDVWWSKELAEVTGLSQETIRLKFSKNFEPFKAAGRNFIRLKNAKEAQLLIGELKALAQEQPKRSSAVT